MNPETLYPMTLYPMIMCLTIESRTRTFRKTEYPVAELDSPLGACAEASFGKL